MTKEEFHNLDDDFIVCTCMGVELGEIKKAINAGHDTVDKLIDETGAGEACELCRSREIDEDDDRELRLDEVLEYYNS